MREASAMTEIYVGTSGWAYKAWQPEFFPAKLPSKLFLRYYSTQLNAVEVNYTFRHLLSERTIDNWLAETPAGFRFAIKAHQSITHLRRLTNLEEPLQRFLSSIQPLAAAGRLGPVLFQLPPMFKADPERLDSLLAMLPRSLKAAFEFRHASWFRDEIYEILRRHRAGLCFAESEDLETPEILTAGFAYFRYRKPAYDASQRASLSAHLADISAQIAETYAFFKHEESPESALNALGVLRAVTRVQAQKAG
jgi:uncharacterized protein YecE (DUF72 family)